MSLVDTMLAGASPHVVTLIDRIVAADRARDLDAFMALLTEDAELRIGSLPWADKPAARKLIGGLFQGVTAIDHRLTAPPFERGETLVYMAEVTFTRRDGRDVTLPYVNVLERSGDLVRRYDIHMDPSPLLAPPVAVGSLFFAGLAGWFGYRLGCRRSTQAPTGSSA